MSHDTIRALRAGHEVELEGVAFAAADGPICAGDWYIAERNTGPKLLTAHSFIRYLGQGESEPVANSEHSSWILSEEKAYPYDTHECVKVREA